MRFYPLLIWGVSEIGANPCPVFFQLADLTKNSLFEVGPSRMSGNGFRPGMADLLAALLRGDPRSAGPT